MKWNSFRNCEKSVVTRPIHVNTLWKPESVRNHSILVTIDLSLFFVTLYFDRYSALYRLVFFHELHHISIEMRFSNLNFDIFMNIRNALIYYMNVNTHKGFVPKWILFYMLLLLLLHIAKQGTDVLLWKMLQRLTQFIEIAFHSTNNKIFYQKCVRCVIIIFYCVSKVNASRVSARRWQIQ